MLGRAGPLAAALASLLLGAGAARAEFRGDELEPRDYDYADDHFINQFSYRQRLTHRWAWGNAASARWRWFWSDTALGYNITAGSQTTSELHLHQEAIVRLPWSNNLTGEYRFIESEDHDERWHRSEVEVLFRFFRPAYRLPLLDTLGRTPPEDGLFIGGQGLLDAEKWNADLGWVLGWRGEWFGVRLDLVQPDYWFNEKNKERAEYTSDPLTLRAKVGALLLGGDLELLAWFENDVPLRVELPERQELVAHFRQLEAGFAARWRVAPGVRVDVEVHGERTRTRRRSPIEPALNDALDRDAGRVILAGEVDVAPLLRSSSRATDVVLLGLYGFAMDEDRRPRSSAAIAAEVRRGEAFAEVGYVMGLPSFSPEYVFGLRVATQNGFVGMRDVRPADDKHTVTQRLVSKLGLGLEVVFREGLGFAFFQLTFRADQLTFGGGNCQVMMRF